MPSADLPSLYITIVGKLTPFHLYGFWTSARFSLLYVSIWHVLPPHAVVIDIMHARRFACLLSWIVIKYLVLCTLPHQEAFCVSSLVPGSQCAEDHPCSPMDGKKIRRGVSASGGSTSLWENPESQLVCHAQTGLIHQQYISNLRLQKKATQGFQVGSASLMYLYLNCVQRPNLPSPRM